MRQMEEKCVKLLVGMDHVLRESQWIDEVDMMIID